MDILNQIKNFLNKYKLLNKNSHFLVGFSGGADSMLLLYCLKKLQKEVNFELSALHINHGWRGEESDEEEKNCKNFCNKYKIDFYSERLGSDIKKDENSARIARYILFKNYAKKLRTNAIFTAHNSTDVIETFIYRLAKGTGTIGAESIPEYRTDGEFKIYRPLLHISSIDIRNTCNKLKLKYNVDSSNFDNKYNRNFIRNEILPKFQKINPSFETAILDFIENLKSNNRIVENSCQKNHETGIVDNKIITRDFMRFSDDIKRIVIYKYLKLNDFEPDKKLILNMVKNIEKNADKPNGRRYSVKNAQNSVQEVSFFCSKSECYFVEKKVKNKIFKKYEKKLGKPFVICDYKGDKIPASDELTAVINKNAFKFPLELRARKSGDLIQPFSHKSKIKLKDYFISQKIPEHKRDEIPLLCSGKEVLWAIGIGLSEKLRANLSDTKNCKIIKYKK